MQLGSVGAAGEIGRELERSGTDRSGPTWCLTRTKPQREAFAAHHVRRLGHTCYLPMFWDARLKRRLVLFASYLFVLAQNRQLFWLNTLPGIVHVIRFGEFLACVPAPLIEALRSRENAHGNVVLPSQEELVPGDPVKLLHGPLEGRIGLYQGMTNRDRVCVLLTFLNQSTPVYLERTAVERVAVPA